MKKWLLPIFTALAVLGCVLLPPRLSEWKDAKMWGAALIEAAPELSDAYQNGDSLLSERLALLARYWVEQDGISAYSETVADREQLSACREMMDRELEALETDQILPPEMGLENYAMAVVRIFLQDDRTGLQADYYAVECRGVGSSVEMNTILDAQTGRALQIGVYDDELTEESDSLPSTGGVGLRFFQRLELETTFRDGQAAVYFFPVDGVVYGVMRGPSYLAIYPADPSELPELDEILAEPASGPKKDVTVSIGK